VAALFSVTAETAGVTTSVEATSSFSFSSFADTSLPNLLGKPSALFNTRLNISFTSALL
jgi:hypothetical protein